MCTSTYQLKLIFLKKITPRYPIWKEKTQKAWRDVLFPCLVHGLWLYSVYYRKSHHAKCVNLDSRGDDCDVLASLTAQQN